jgi:hypothetical protein
MLWECGSGGNVPLLMIVLALVVVVAAAAVVVVVVEVVGVVITPWMGVVAVELLSTPRRWVITQTGIEK